MFMFSRDELVELANHQNGWAVSLYMPLHPQNGERRQDVIRLRNLLKDAEQQLTRNGMSASARAELLYPARAFVETMPFRESIDDGLALFVAAQFFASFQCPLSFQERAVVGREMYIKPLLPLAEQAGTFYVLALSENHVRLLRGLRDGLTEVPMPHMPHSLKEALDSEEVEKQHQYRTIAPTVGTGSRMAIFYGQGQGIEDKKERLSRFLAMVNHGVSNVLREEHAPLVAAGVGYLIPLYRHVNDYAGLCDAFIPGNPDGWSPNQLHQRAREIAASSFKQPLEHAQARYQQLQGTPRTAETLDEILPAAAQGRIETLFLRAGADRWGYFHPETGALSQHDEYEATDQELLNLAAIHTLRGDGEIYLLDAQEMPVAASSAAILRY